MFLIISYEKLPFLQYNYTSSSIDKKKKIFWCKFKASKLIFLLKMEMKLLNLKDMKDSHSEVNQDTRMITHSIEEMELEEEEEEFQKRDMEKETGAQTETKLKKLLLKEILKKLLKDKAGLEMLMLKKKKRRENLEEKRKL